MGVAAAQAGHPGRNAGRSDWIDPPRTSNAVRVPVVSGAGFPSARATARLAIRKPASPTATPRTPAVAHVGISAGAAAVAARKVAEELGPGKHVVTVLCDTGERYFSLDSYFTEERGGAPDVP